MSRVSVFYKEDDTIIRVIRDDFGPGDNYCPTFPLFDLLKDGTNNWQVKYYFKFNFYSYLPQKIHQNPESYLLKKSEQISSRIQS
jgi:hypothetical protein